MQPERDQKDNLPWDDQVRSRGNKAGFAFQDRDCKDRYDLTQDWEWYSKGEAARLTYGGPNGEEKLIFDALKGSLTIDGNVGIGTTTSAAKLHVTGDLQVDKGATINDLLTANKGLTVNGGALTVLNSNSLNAQGGATISGGALTVAEVLKAQKGAIISGAILDAQAGASITGDLTVKGKATINDLLTANKGLTVNGGALTVLNGNALNAQGGATISGGALTVAEVLKAQKGAIISGAILDAQAGASITGDLTVKGKATINDLLTANKGLTVNGGALTVLNGNALNAQGGATISGGALTVAEVLKAQKGAIISGAILDAQAGASITGDLTVKGKATINDLLTANKGLTVNGGALTVLNGNALNAQGGATIIGSVGIGTVSPGGKLDVLGDIRAGNSDIYFTKTDHKHTGIGNTDGYAAIENAEDFGALMILGRAGTPEGRKVRLWDYLQVDGDLQVEKNLVVKGTLEITKLKLDRFTIYMSDCGIFKNGLMIDFDGKHAMYMKTESGVRSWLGRDGKC